MIISRTLRYTVTKVTGRYNTRTEMSLCPMSTLLNGDWTLSAAATTRIGPITCSNQKKILCNFYKVKKKFATVVLYNLSTAYVEYSAHDEYLADEHIHRQL